MESNKTTTENDKKDSGKPRQKKKKLGRAMKLLLISVQFKANFPTTERRKGPYKQI